MKKWKKWLHGLLAAVISSASTTIGAIAGSAAAGADHIDLGQVSGAAIGGAIMGAVLYLKQSPLPPDEE